MFTTYGALLTVIVLAIVVWLASRWISRQNEERGRGVIGILTWSLFKWVLVPVIIFFAVFGIVVAMISVTRIVPKAMSFGETNGVPLGDAKNQLLRLVCGSLSFLCGEGWESAATAPVAKVGEAGAGGGVEYVAPPMAETGGSGVVAPKPQLRLRTDALAQLAAQFQVLYGTAFTTWPATDRLLTGAKIPAGINWTLKCSSCSSGKEKELWILALQIDPTVADLAGLNPKEATVEINGFQARDSRGLSGKNTGIGLGLWLACTACYEEVVSEIPEPIEPVVTEEVPPPAETGGGVSATCANPVTVSVTAQNTKNQTVSWGRLVILVQEQLGISVTVAQLQGLNPSFSPTEEIPVGPLSICIAP